MNALVAFEMLVLTGGAGTYAEALLAKESYKRPVLAFQAQPGRQSQTVWGQRLEELKVTIVHTIEEVEVSSRPKMVNSSAIKGYLSDDAFPSR